MKHNIYTDDKNLVGSTTKLANNQTKSIAKWINNGAKIVYEQNI